jgi:hypothetical protein
MSAGLKPHPQSRQPQKPHIPSIPDATTQELSQSLQTSQTMLREQCQECVSLSFVSCASPIVRRARLTTFQLVREKNLRGSARRWRM